MAAGPRWVLAGCRTAARCATRMIRFKTTPAMPTLRPRLNTVNSTTARLSIRGIILSWRRARELSGPPIGRATTPARPGPIRHLPARRPVAATSRYRDAHPAGRRADRHRVVVCRRPATDRRQRPCVLRWSRHAVDPLGLACAGPCLGSGQELRHESIDEFRGTASDAS